MRYVLVVLSMLFGLVTSAVAQVSVGIGLPGVSIGINLSLYPELVQVPDYPVYYAPRMNSNYFFYDGMYWVYQSDNWYASSWYNGPWGMVGPEVVPLYVLRIPVRYYRDPPGYFRGWRSDAPPRWGQHWGNEWEQRRRGWDKWNHASAPRPAPLPAYQRQYSGDRYPQGERQRALHSQNYRYQPRDAVVRQHYQEHAVQKAPAPAQRAQPAAPQERRSRQQDIQRSSPPRPAEQSAPAAPRAQPPQRGGENVQKSAPTQAPAQQRGPAVQEQSRQPQQGAVKREQQAPRSGQESVPQGRGASKDSGRGQAQEKDLPQGKGASKASGRGQGQEKDREKGAERK